MFPVLSRIPGANTLPHQFFLFPRAGHVAGHDWGRRKASRGSARGGQLSLVDSGGMGTRIISRPRLKLLKAPGNHG